MVKWVAFYPFIRYLVPLLPSGFNITGEVYTVTNLTVTFEWDAPRDRGPQAIVDTYIVSISPQPLFPFDVSRLPNSQLALHVTLDYNTTYMAIITAENCAGKSETFIYPDAIEYGVLWSLNFFQLDKEFSNRTEPNISYYTKSGIW